MSMSAERHRPGSVDPLQHLPLGDPADQVSRSASRRPSRRTHCAGCRSPSGRRPARRSTLSRMNVLPRERPRSRAAARRRGAPQRRGRAESRRSRRAPAGRAATHSTSSKRSSSLFVGVSRLSSRSGRWTITSRRMPTSEPTCRVMSVPPREWCSVASSSSQGGPGSTRGPPSLLHLTFGLRQHEDHPEKVGGAGPARTSSAAQRDWLIQAECRPAYVPSNSTSSACVPRSTRRPVVEDEHLVGGLCRGQPVGDRHRRAASGEPSSARASRTSVAGSTALVASSSTSRSGSAR